MEWVYLFDVWTNPPGCVVIEFATHHMDEPIMTEKDEAELLCMYKNEAEALSEWDRETFFKPMTEEYLLDLIIAANYLDLTRLSCTAAKVLADRLKRYDVPMMRKLFGVAPKEEPKEEVPPSESTESAEPPTDPAGEPTESTEATESA